MLTMSVAVVKKMLDAVAGSAPKRFSVSGTMAPEIPLIVHAPVMARNPTIATPSARGEFCTVAG